MPSDYIAQTKPIAERRVVLAGYRLADLLAQVAQTLTLKPTAVQSGHPEQMQTAAILGNKRSRIITACRFLATRR